MMPIEQQQTSLREKWVEYITACHVGRFEFICFVKRSYTLLRTGSETQISQAGIQFACIHSVFQQLLCKGLFKIIDLHYSMQSHVLYIEIDIRCKIIEFSTDTGPTKKFYIRIVDEQFVSLFLFTLQSRSLYNKFQRKLLRVMQ